jgi:hypothetical protein
MLFRPPARVWGARWSERARSRVRFSFRERHRFVDSESFFPPKIVPLAKEHRQTVSKLVSTAVSKRHESVREKSGTNRDTADSLQPKKKEKARHRQHLVRPRVGRGLRAMMKSSKTQLASA